MGKYLYAPLAATLLFSSSAALAADAPSNEQLFEMMKAMQSKLASLEAENSKLRNSLSKAEMTAIAPAALGELRQEFDTKIEVVKAEVVATSKASPAQKPANDGKDPWEFTVGTTGYYVFGDAFAYVRPGSASSGVNGTGEAADHVDHSLAPSIDISALYNVPASSWNIGADFSYLHSKESASNSSAVNDTTVAGFGLSSSVAAQTFDGTSDLYRAIGGINAGYNFVNSPDANFGIDLGLRGGGLSHELRISSDANREYNNRMRFVGAGPRIGFSGSYELGGGFGLVGATGGTMLIGYSNLEQIQPQDNERLEEDGLRVVPVFDARFAGSYDTNFGGMGFGVELGLKAEHWTNLPAWYSPSHNASVNPSKSDADDMTFVGPYLEIKGTF